MSQYTRKDPPWSHVGVPGAGLNQTLMQQNQSLLGAQPGVVGTPTTNVYGQSMVSNTGLGAAGATTAYPTPQQTMQQRQNIALQQQQAAAQNAAAAAAAAGSQGGGTPQLTVSYPTTRATQGGQPRQRVFTGTVTKLHDTFGFVDEDVFFQTNTVKGTMPKIGERVLVEATYNASMPFKWNATRIQLLNSPLEQQVAPPAPQQQHHAAMKMQQLKQIQQQQQPSRIENVSQQFKMLKQSQQPLLKAPQASNMMPTHSQPPPPGLLGNPPPLLQQPPPGVVQQPALLQGNTQAMQNLAGAYAHQGRTSQIGQQSIGRRDFSSSGSRERDRDRDRERERDRAQRERDRERDREHRERERERERDRRERDRAREREKSPVKRSRSPRRSKSPRRSPRRTKRLVQRYCVQIPRFALDIPKSDVIELHKRYMNMYIPSDFFLANFAWQDVFPIHRPMNVAQPCTFHIMHKEAPPPQGAATVIDPPDANYSYCAKVMLMTSVSQEELYEKCCARAQDPSEVRENFQHPTRLINFLVGQKGKNEVMAIGGPWSPSLDGADPVNDTSVLIKTAIRTTKALTGIDLTTCTQWYRFLELSYHRPEEIHKGRVIPARVETVVIFVPDVWHILPTKVEWESLTELYKKTLSNKLVAVDNRDKKTEETATPTQEESAAKEEEEEAEAEEQEQHQTPTNWKDLDPKNMKVNELRQELEIRGLNSKGLKSQLIARLTKMLKSEQEMEDAEPAAMETDAAPEDAKEEQKDAPREEESSEKDKEKDKKDKEEKEKKEKEDEKKRELVEEEKRRQREREKRDLEMRYTMPEVPAILVHPSPIAKSGKFDCSQQSLSVLLDYRVEDNKEHSFEVFLFAELFNEMLQRDFAFNMYKAVYRAPEKKEEKKDDKKKDKDKKDEKEKKDEKKDERKDDRDEKKEDKKEDEPKAKRRRTEEKDAEKEEYKDKDEGQKDEDSREDDKDGEEEDNDGKSNEDDGDDDDKKKDRKGKDDKSKVRVKMETHDPHLLLSCIYFDQNHCGYILERDLEEILYTVGLHLSRAQVRKLLQKVVTRDCWSYRKLTDGPKKEKDDTTKTAEANNVPSDSDLAKGNQMILENMASSKKGSKGMAPDGVTMVKYGGTVIDIANLLKQVQKADQERSMAEKKIESLEKQIETLKSKASSSEATVTNVSGELLDVQKKLSSSERALLGSSTRSKKLIDVIGSAQKNLDEIMLKFNEVLEEAMLPPTAGKITEKVAEKVTEKVVEKVKEEPKVKTEAKPAVKVEAKSPKGEK